MRHKKKKDGIASLFDTKSSLVFCSSTTTTVTVNSLLTRIPFLASRIFCCVLWGALLLCLIVVVKVHHTHAY